MRFIKILPKRIRSIILISLWFTGSTLAGSDYLYFKNFVRHADGSFCEHLPPQTTFSAYLNHNQNWVLIENAPRWQSGGDPNIPGTGVFGVEIGNFSNPPVAVGDTVFARFTCNATGQQGTVSAQIFALPGGYIPSHLYLQNVTLPNPPQNVVLTRDTTSFYRIISWTSEPGLVYDVYRRVYSDTLPGGEPRMQYFRIAQNINAGQFTDSTALPDEQYGYIVYAISPQGIRSSHSSEVNEDPYVRPGMDLTIRYIARLPRIDYVWGSSNPAVEGWPVEGQTVTWRAVVVNWSDSSVANVHYTWAIDGSPVDSGTVDIPASDTAFVDFPWVWTFNRHQIKFILDSKNEVAEEEEGNNSVLLYSNAISVGFYVEQSLYDYFHTYQNELGVHSNSWEDWAHRHVQRWNAMFQAAQYPGSPQGVLDRIRLDKITIVPDGALPLHGGLPTNHPNMNDRTVDLQWGFPASLLTGGMYSNHTSTSLNNPFYFEGSLLHELGHARYLIDLYGFNVHDDGSGNTVAIKENGQLIVGTPYMPLIGGAVYFTPIQGLMNGQYTFVDEYSAMALNLIAGHRAVMGNYNAPLNIGVFINDLPLQNRLTVKDENGNILPNAEIKIYQAAPQPGVWYGKYYDNIPDLELTTDSVGVVLLGRCPFSSNGQITHTYGHSNGVLILRVAYAGKVGYSFLESTFFNMKFWSGQVDTAYYEIQVKLIETTGMSENPDEIFSRDFQLFPNFPNPFNPETIISFTVPRSEFIELEVFNNLGQMIRRLFSGNIEPGYHQISWDGRNQFGEAVPSGVYFYRLKSKGGTILTQKMILMK
ncbi:MAG: hypothetical protein Kow0042_27520 [Calditrichia bacterium]